MALIANLAVGLTVEAGQFASKLRGASKSVNSFASSISSYATGTTAKLTGLIAAVTGVGSVAALAHFTRQSMEMIDVNAKLADRLNSSTEGLIGLQHAATLSGSSTETLNSALDKLTKNLGNGGTGVEGALKQIGLSRSGLLGKGAVEQFKLIAEGIRNLSSSEARAAVITDLFGKTGQELTATLMLGADGLKANEEWTRKLGLAYSRVDAFKVEAANDALTDMISLLKGVFNQIGIQVAPLIERIALGITGFGTSGKGAAELVKAAFEGLVVILDKAVTLVGDIAAGLVRAAAGFLRLTPYVRMLLEAAPGGGAAVKAIDWLTGGTGTGQDKADAANAAADRLAQISDSILHGTGRGTVSSQVAIAQRMAQEEADRKAAADEHSRNQALSDAADATAVRGQIDSGFAGQIIGAITRGFPFIVKGAAALAEAQDQAKQKEMVRQLDAANTDNFNHHFTDFFDRPTPVSEAASAGTRGTFASDTAGRSVGVFTVAKAQLDTLKSIDEHLQHIDDNGVVANAG